MDSGNERRLNPQERGKEAEEVLQLRVVCFVNMQLVYEVPFQGDSSNDKDESI